MGVRPTKRDVFLLAEHIRRDHDKRPVRGRGAVSVKNSEKAEIISQELIEHMATWDSSHQFQQRDQSNIVRDVKTLLAKKASVRSKAGKQGFLDILDDFFLFYNPAPEPAVEVRGVPSGSGSSVVSGPVSEASSGYQPPPNFRHQKSGTSEIGIQTEMSIKVTSRNMLSLQNVAAAAERKAMSHDEVALILTAFLQDMKIVNEDDIQNVVSVNKIKKARELFRENHDAALKKDLQENPVDGVYFDSKIIQTCTTENIDEKEVRKKKAVDQYVISTCDGRFLESCTVEAREGEDDLQHAERVGQRVVEIADNWIGLENLKVVGGDTTATNTGQVKGAFAVIEKLTGRKLYHVECQLHIYELPMKEALKALVGRTMNKSKLEGKIGDLLLEANDLK